MMRGFSAERKGVLQGSARYLTAAFTAAGLIFAAAGAVQAESGAGNASAVPQPLTELNGQDLSAQQVYWRRRLMSAPEGRDILADTSGALCDLGQKGDIWYLAGSYETNKIIRHCIVPQGKYLFIPVADTMLWDSADGRDCVLLQSDVKTAMDTAHNLFLEADGHKIENLSHCAAARHCFTLPHETDIYASDGYWVLLKPLPKGRHILRFGNKMGDDGETTENSARNIEYRLEVR